MPERESPETRIGEPRTKMTRLVRRADGQVGGDDWISFIASDTALCTLPAWTTIIFRGLLGLGLEFWKRIGALLLRKVAEWWNWDWNGETEMGLRRRKGADIDKAIISYGFLFL